MKKASKIIEFAVKILRAILYVLSAGHICSCGKKKDTEEQSVSDTENQ